MSCRWLRLNKTPSLTVLAWTCLSVGIIPTAFAAPTTAAVQDLGIVSPSLPVKATVWLKRSDQAGFDAALAAIQDSSSPRYQHWLSSTDLAAYAPSATDLQTVRQSLLSAGIAVGRIAEDNSSIEVSGDAATMGRAFATSLHSYARGSTSYVAATTTPVLSGTAGGIVASITGLHLGVMRPMLIEQQDPATGQALRLPLSAPGARTDASPGNSPLNPYLTSDCFKGSTSIALTAPEASSGSLTLSARAYANGVVSSGGPLCGYDSIQLRHHYGFDSASAKRLDGTGQTVVIEVAYGSPYVQQAVNVYSSDLTLPALDASNFQVVTPLGQPNPNDPDNPGDWPTETILDVTMVHAIAPKAKIVLLVSPSDQNNDLISTLRYGYLHRLGNVFSMSFGAPEAGADTADVHAFADATAIGAIQGISTQTASGDAGDNGVGTSLGASSVPADSPFVTSVGGTTLSIPTNEGVRDLGWGLIQSTPNNGRRVRTLFSPALLGSSGSGGGESLFFPRPRWQAALPGTGRQQPDISAVGDPSTGVAVVLPDVVGTTVYWTLGIVGGTSVATPVISAMTALADQQGRHLIGQLAPLAARMPSWALTDIRPLGNSEPIVAATDTLTGQKLNSPVVSPAGLAFLPTGTNGIEQFFINGAEFDYGIITYGHDTSLTVHPGWDNVTGYGEPNGSAFLAAAALESLGVPLTSLSITEEQAERLTGSASD